MPLFGAETKAGQHWAFQPPRSYPVPAVKLTSWPHSPIDNFVLAKLEDKGLQPSPPADKRTLIRRASYDLAGLPPTAEEVESFITDPSPDAFAKVVDRLLASPRYGERWGRYWLDVARFSDTKGYVYDREEKRFVHSYAYRDWVISAFNEDLPYDQFLLLQIAADQLSPGSTSSPPDSSLAAMGFLTLGRRFLGVIHDIIDDRIDVVTRGTMGLTVACARCHDHKFDPIPTRDYYSLYGIFYNSAEKTVPVVARPVRTEEFVAFEKELAVRTDKLNQTFKAKCDELADRLRAKAAEYLLAVLDVEKLPSEEFYAIMGKDDLNPIIARQWDAYLFKTRREAHPVWGPWHAFAALPKQDFAVRAAALAKGLAAQADSVTNEPVHRLNKLVAQAFIDQTPASMREVAQIYGKLLTDSDQAWRVLVNAATNNVPPKPARSDSLPDSALRTPHSAPPRLPNPDQEELRQVLYGPDSPAQVSAGSIAENEFFFDEKSREEVAKLQAEIDRWIIKSPGAPPHAVVLKDRLAPRNARVFVRGNPANRGEEVPRQFLQILAGAERKPFSIGSGRLELARAIANKDNPLTARVMVNRIWLHHFGAGLARTPSDFGTRSEPPTHPELLDWLACHFMDDGWSIKKLHRLIMLSSVYQQSSDVPSGGRAALRAAGQSHVKTSEPDHDSSGASPSRIDPENRLLWRMARRRLDFEAMRDSLLSVSGGLDLQMRGRPAELFSKPVNARRTVYGFVDRQFLPGVFRVFDYANPDTHSPQRYDTTVPQQALFFMNSPFVLEHARALANRPDVAMRIRPEQRIRRLYELVYQRPPTPQQIETGLRFLKTMAAEPPPEPPRPVVSAWKYGYGELDEATQRVKTFEPLPHFTGEAWQGGPNWPDPKLGWVQLTAEGGHAGNDLQHAAIRRWTAPQPGVVTIDGTARHESKEGDGIRARIISSRTGLLHEWILHNDKAEARVESITVEKNDTIDFIVDYRANLNSDMFKWAPAIKRIDPLSANLGADHTTQWDAKKEFSGPPETPPQPLSPWEEYAQVLLLANEFVFVD